ncbi:hypothetical protein V2J09_021790 [Rumex salicifolius]
MENPAFEAQEALIPGLSEPRVSDMEMAFVGVNQPFAQEQDSPMLEDEEYQIDSMICNSGSRLVRGGISERSCSEDVIMFINAGDEAQREVDSRIKLVGDAYYNGGNVVRTHVTIDDAGDCPFVYQSARFGNFSYQFNDLPPGNYFADLHFAEIINSNGPKGMRLFNVLSEFDIYALVGANKPIQFVDSRLSVKEDGMITIRFEDVLGSPIVCGIGIRRAPELFVAQPTNEFLRCHSCTAQIEVPLSLAQNMQQKNKAKYEKKIEDLTIQVQRKKEECSEAWMSLAAANQQLENIRSELDKKFMDTFSQDQKLVKQADDLKKICTKYEKDKRFWITAIVDLEEKIKTMKQEHNQLSREAHECADSIPELNQMIFAVQALVSECKDLKIKYLEEQKMRKKYFNQVQEVKGNIRVFCRCRPLSKQEQAAGCMTTVDFEGAKDGDITTLTSDSKKKTFKFDRVYTPKDDQVDVFADASPMVTSVLDGYNVCIFAYGQTGTGKTFTMEGTELNRGVNYRTLDQLFKVAQDKSDTSTYDIYVSVLEIYNEQIRDLLSTSPPTKRLDIKQTPEGSHYVPGIVEAKVESIKEAWEILRIGSNSRAVGSNNVNEHSIKAKNLINGDSTKSNLWLVDLAGSERLAKTDVQGERLKEAQNINKSLSALGDVISALANKSSHIPYRNSKLTQLLQDSLGGDSKALMFVQISPADKDVNETVSSLNFASRVRGVDLGPAKRQVDTGELQKTKMQLDKAKMEARAKDESIRKLEESLQNLENKAKGRDHTYKSQQEKIRELEDELGAKSALHSQTEKQILQLQERLKGKEEVCNSLERNVKELENNLRESELSDSATVEQVKALEKKLKEQILESQSHSIVLQNKITELEAKLKQQEQIEEETSKLHQKINELETKLREQEQAQPLHSVYPEATPVPVGIHPTRDNNGVLCEVDPLILKSSTSSNRMSNVSTLAKGKEVTNEVIRRKRGSKEFRGGDTENNMPVSSIHDKKIRKSDPPKPTRLSTRVAKSVAGPTTRPSSIHGRSSRDQIRGDNNKDKDLKKRMRF